MKKTLLYLLLLPFSPVLTAQQYVPLQVTSGYNADVIANGVNAAAVSTSSGLDNANFCLMAANFQANVFNTPPSYALPVSGLLTSPYTSGLAFQFASYDGNNSLRLQEQNNSGTLVFGNPLAALKIYVLLTSGSGESTMSGTITFTDNTTQTIATTTIPDWFYSTLLPVAISGIGRIGRLDNIIETSSDNPRLYQKEIALAAANQTKGIASIQFTKTSLTEGTINIFGVSVQQNGLGLTAHTAPEFSVYPNPTRSQLTVSGSQMIKEASVYNFLGQKVKSQKGFEPQMVLQTDAFPDGGYILKIETDYGVQSLNFIKQ